MKLFKRLISAMVAATMIASMYTVVHAETSANGEILSSYIFDDLSALPAVKGKTSTASLYSESNNKMFRHTGDGGWEKCWFKPTDLATNVRNFWNDTTVPRNLVVDFDMRISANSKFFVFLGAEEDIWSDGLNILSLSGNNVGFGDEGGNDRTRLTTDSLTPNKWYHYTFELDIDKKTATAKLSDGTNTYSLVDQDVALEYKNWWKSNLKTPFNGMGILNPSSGTTVDLDNIVFSQKVPDALSAKISNVDGGYIIGFNTPVTGADSSSITLINTTTGTTVAYSGGLSSTGKQYTITPDNSLAAGVYKINISTSVTPVNSSVTGFTKDYNYMFVIKDQTTLGCYVFDDLATLPKMVGNTSMGTLYSEGGNKMLRINSNTSWEQCWMKPTDLETSMNTFWNDETVSRKLSIDFDIRISKNNYFIVFLGNNKNNSQYGNGLNMLSQTIKDGDGYVGFGDEGGNSKTRLTTDGLTPNKWYHYTFELDIDKKTATAKLSDGTNTYSIVDQNVALEYNYWWKNNLDTPFVGLGVLNPKDDTQIDLDNIMFKKVVDSPAVSAEKIKIYANDTLQTKWDAVQVDTNKISIDFGTEMDASTIENNVYLKNKSTGEKVNATGVLNRTIYTLTLSDTLTQNTEYTLVIEKDVANIVSATLGVGRTYDIKTNAGSVSANAVGLVKGEAVVSALSEIAAGDNVKLNITYSNTTGEAQAFYTIVAYYNGNMLTQVDLVKFNKAANVTSEQISVDYTVPELNGATRAAIMCWDGFSELRPLGTVKEF